jgi:hypothetical protein
MQILWAFRYNPLRTPSDSRRIVNAPPSQSSGDAQYTGVKTKK